MSIKAYGVRGLLLVSMPSLRDPHFTRSVVLIIDHDSDGAFGLVLNRPQHNLPVSDILDDLHIPTRIDVADVSTFFGGPVGTTEVFVLHGPPFHWQGCELIADEFAITSSRDILEAIALGEGPEVYKIMLGSSGWAANQLEEELKLHAWLTCPPSMNLIFHTNANTCWENALDSLGISEELLSIKGGKA